ncbi:MAG: rane protein involved in the export of O-antigen and teichoic acid-like protein, partial [Solirubrobacterales bacterium]|nr:rane protein involved in the export of O-antigen and teichoic acid-like protein [Solirubrobacterales bacterium]
MRLREHLRDPLYRSAYALMASTVLTALLGVGFWALAARTASAREIGRDAVLISSLITLSSICQLNLVDALVRFLPGVRNRDRSRRIAAAYAASAAAGLLGGTAFVLGAPRVSARLAFLQGDRATAVVFVAAMGLWGIFVLQDAVLTALRRATWLPAENAAYSLAKIALLPLVLAAGSAHTVFLAWVLPTLVVVPVINILLHVRVLRPAARSAPDAAARRLELRGRGLARFMLQDYAGFVLGQSAITLVPLVVIARLGSEQSAWF